MKITYIFTPFAMAVGAFFWISASGGVAQMQSKDRTGSPVSDVACTQCHQQGANFSAAALIQITDPSGTIVTEYLPGEQYKILVNISANGNVGHGFQITGMLNDNSSAGTCAAVTGNTQITALNGRWYYESNRGLTGGQYEMTWTAPAAGSGVVTFYGSALATNGNGTTGGDEYVNIPNVVIPEGAPNSVSELDAKVWVSTYPNPVLNVLNVQADQELERVEVYNLSGQQVSVKYTHGFTATIETSELAKGSYVLNTITRSGEESSKLFIKQ